MIAGIAILTLLCAFSLAAPIVGFFCFIVLPAPVVFYRVALGRKHSGIMLLCSGLLIALFMEGISVNTLFLLTMMGLGYLMGERIEKGDPAEKIIGYAMAQIAAAAAAGLIVYGNISNIGALGLISDYIGKNIDATISLYQEMGMPDDKLRMVVENRSELQNLLIRIVPGMFAAGLLFTSWMNFLISGMLIQKKLGRMPAMAQLNQWKAPDQMVWGIIAGIALILVPAAPLKTLGLNALIVLMTVYFFQGIAIVSFYLEKKKIPLPFRALLYGLIGIQQVLALMVVGLGFFDVWMNFRRIGINNNHE